VYAIIGISRTKIKMLTGLKKQAAFSEYVGAWGFTAIKGLSGFVVCH
jgi:hypothetical protein